MDRIQTSQGYYKFSQENLFVGIKQIDKNIAFENLCEVKRILSKAGIKFGPIFGTLLGIIRDNDFIIWDEDVDLYILKEEEKQFRDTLWDFKDKGFDLIRYERRGLYSIRRNGEYIDFYVLKSISPKIRHSGGRDFLLEKYIQNVLPWNFKGLELQIPSDYEEYLEFTYGDWKKPVKYANYEMPFAKKTLVKWGYILKRKLPDFLYFPLIKYYHRKDYLDFIKKCQSKGIDLS